MTTSIDPSTDPSTDPSFLDKVMEKYRKSEQLNELITIPEFEKVIRYGKGLSPSAKAIESSLWFIITKKHNADKDVISYLNKDFDLDRVNVKSKKAYLIQKKTESTIIKTTIMESLHHPQFYDDMLGGTCLCDDSLDKRQFTWGELLFHSYTYKSTCECKYIKPVFKSSEVPTLSTYKIYIGFCENLKDYMGCVCALNTALINAAKLGIHNLSKVSTCKYDNTE